MNRWHVARSCAVVPAFLLGLLLGTGLAVALVAVQMVGRGRG